MKRGLLLSAGVVFLLSAALAPVRAEILPDFGIRSCTFVWDCGSKPAVADADDVFFDWTIPCNPQGSILSSANAKSAGRAKCSDPGREIDQIHRVLAAYGLQEEAFNGFILRARLGHSGSPLFVLAPGVHPQIWIDQSKGKQIYRRSHDLHLSNIADFLYLAAIARRNGRSVSNASEMMNLLLGGRYLKRVRRTISQTMRRRDYPSDIDWARSILRKGLVDAGTFLTFVFEDDATLRHVPVESAESYVNSTLLNLVLILRHRSSVGPGQTLYEAYEYEYELGLAYSGSLEHRFSGSPLMDRFRQSWRQFKRYSQLSEQALLQAINATCEQRSQNMAARLMKLVSIEQTDYYLVTFGPLHLHGVLKALEHNSSSYLLLAPRPYLHDALNRGM